MRTLKDDLDRYRATGEETGKPSLASLRKRWNQEKGAECADAVTGPLRGQGLTSGCGPWPPSPPPPAGSSHG